MRFSVCLPLLFCFCGSRASLGSEGALLLSSAAADIFNAGPSERYTPSGSVESLVFWRNVRHFSGLSLPALGTEFLSLVKPYQSHSSLRVIFDDLNTPQTQLGGFFSVGLTRHSLIPTIFLDYRLNRQRALALLVHEYFHFLQEHHQASGYAYYLYEASALIFEDSLMGKSRSLIFDNLNPLEFVQQRVALENAITGIKSGAEKLSADMFSYLLTTFLIQKRGLTREEFFQQVLKQTFQPLSMVEFEMFIPELLTRFRNQWAGWLETLANSPVSCPGVFQVSVVSPSKIGEVSCPGTRMLFLDYGGITTPVSDESGKRYRSRFSRLGLVIQAAPLQVNP